MHPIQTLCVRHHHMRRNESAVKYGHPFFSRIGVVFIIISEQLTGLNIPVDFYFRSDLTGTLTRLIFFQCNGSSFRWWHIFVQYRLWRVRIIRSPIWAWKHVYITIKILLRIWINRCRIRVWRCHRYSEILLVPKIQEDWFNVWWNRIIRPETTNTRLQVNV